MFKLKSQLLIVGILIMSIFIVKKDLIKNTILRIKNPNQIANNKPIAERYMKKILDPFYQHFQPVVYDKENNRFCSAIDANTLVAWRETMGIDYAAWTSIATIKKDVLDSAIVTLKYSGTISELDFNKAQKSGNKFLFFYIIGDKGSKTDTWQNQYGLEVAKFYKMVNGKEVPIKMDDLKNGDKIWREEVNDLTITPKDRGFEILQKFLVL